MTIVQSTTDFFFPWRKQLLPGSWHGIEVSDSPNGSQNSSMMWPYLIGTGFLLNRGSFLRLGSVPQEPVGDTDPVDFAGLFAFLDLRRPLLFAPRYLTLHLHGSGDFLPLLPPSVVVPSQRPWKDAGQIPLSL